jgi:predicted transcriptional regulator of viral defense system
MIKCPAGYIPVSTPEETAFDILSYSSSIGGLDRVLTVLKELCEKIDPSILLKVAKKENCISLAQRLGCLIDQTDFGDRTDKLAEWIKRKNPRHVKLDFHLSSANSKKDSRWNVCVNTTVESDIQ